MIITTKINKALKGKACQMLSKQLIYEHREEKNKPYKLTKCKF